MHAGKAVQSCARPLHDRALSASDHQETQPVDLSPVAKGWRDDPPKEHPPSSDGRTFAEIMGRDHDVPPTAVLASPPKNPQTSEVKDSKEPVVAGVQHGEQVKKGMEETGEQDLFHSTVVTTRLEQMQNKKKIEDGEEAQEETTKAKGKGRGRPRAKGKAKGKAKAKSTPKKPKGLPKAKAKSKARSGKRGASEVKHGEAMPKARAKATKRQKADGEAAAAATQVPPENIAAAQVEIPPERTESTAAKQEEPEVVGKKTFARRNRPVREPSRSRFDGIKEIFIKHIFQHVDAPSTMEV